jgi:hypothetical protein
MSMPDGESAADEKNPYMISDVTDKRGAEMK